MKAKDIKEFELGEHCFGETLRVNETDYEDLTKEEILVNMNNNAYICKKQTEYGKQNNTKKSKSKGY